MSVGDSFDALFNLKRYFHTSWYKGLLADFDVFRKRFLTASFLIGLLMPAAVAVVSIRKGEFSNLLSLAIAEVVLTIGLVVSLNASRKQIGSLSHFVLTLYPLAYLVAVLSRYSHHTYVILLIAMPPIVEVLSPRGEKLLWFFYSSFFIVAANVLAAAGIMTSWVRDFSAGDIIVFHSATSIVAALSYLRDRQMVHYLEAQAYRIVRDEATGLPTAAALGEVLRTSDAGILCVVSIDNFYELAALFGYEFCDEIVVYAASRLQTATRKLGGRCFKLHGRDLGIMLSWEGMDEVKADRYVQEFYASIGGPVALKGKNVEIQYSIGYTFFRDGKAAKALNEAGAVLWRGSGRHGVYRHEDSLDTAAVDLAFSRLATLSRCVREGGLEAHFQPVLSLTDGRRAWYETLLRVRGDTGKLEVPSAYLELAKSAGYWSGITDFVLARAIDRIKSGFGSVSVNIGAIDLGREGFRSLAVEGGALAREHGCRLILELLETDTGYLSDEELQVVRMLRTAGCLIAIDDFGKGYSNYSRLLDFPIDIVKFDMSLIQRAANEASVGVLVEGLVRFCSGFGLLTVAEGVETEREVAYVKAIGFDYGQGFFWSRAVPAAEAPASRPWETDAP